MASDARLSKDHIRLLKLVSIDESNIRCSLEAAPLPGIGSAPQYEAVSYVWGSQRENGTIWCANWQGEVAEKAIKVSGNLVSALRHYWSDTAHQQMRLWCDVMCINQEDLKEKAAQVAMMDRIFKSAQRVLVWLGSRPLSGAFDLLKQLSDRGDGLTHLPAVQFGLEEAKHVARLASNQWFCRVWTFQEATLAKTALVLCRDGEIGWQDFARGIRLLIPKIEGSDSELRFSGHVRLLVQENEETEEDMEAREAQYAEDERSGAHEGVFGDSLQLHRFLLFGDSLRQIPPTNLTDLLLQNWYRAATDSRDKIYALLSNEIFPSADKPGVDYDHVSAADLFIQTARRCMNIDKNLKILQIAGLEHWRKYPAGWNHQWMHVAESYRTYVPSWVPCWTQLETNLVLGQISIEGKQGCAKVQAPLQNVRDTSRRLKIDGWVLGVMKIEGPNNWNCWLQMLPANVKSFSQILEDFQVYYGSSSFKHMPHGSVNMTSQRIKKLEIRLDAINLPKEVISGDWLCQLDGSITPFVLRPAYKGDPLMMTVSGNANKFVLVGEAPQTWEIVYEYPGWKPTFIPGTFVLT